MLPYKVTPGFSKVNFIAIKICSANDSFFVVEMIPLRGGGGGGNEFGTRP